MADVTDELADVRERIDEIDDEIAALVAERTEVADRAAEVKAAAGRELVDEDREAAVEEAYAERFRSHDLPGECGREFANQLIDVALASERSVVGTE